MSAIKPSEFPRQTPHINLDNDLPGIQSLLRYRPETGRPLSELAEVLLRGPSTLTRGERELIASYVSSLNDCEFCTGAFAAAQLPEGMPLVDQVRADPAAAPISGKLRALLRIAAAVRRGGTYVRADDIAEAREAGATDEENHDTVLIDGLATLTAAYAASAERIVARGYLAPFTI